MLFIMARSYCQTWIQRVSLWLQVLYVESLHCTDPDSDLYPQWLYWESESESESEFGNVNEPLGRPCH